MQKIKIVLLSGGSGSRLWPLSNGVRSKQFMRLLKNPDGELESMCQRIMRQLKASGLSSDITVATGASQVDSILKQMGGSVDIVAEPERRDTFPAIALASSYLAFEKKCSKDDVVVVMPIDPYTEDGYFSTIRKMADVVADNAANIVLMGIVPTEPSEKFGYIVPEKKSGGEPVKVLSFAEKPDRERAQRLIKEGALWNGGIFAFKMGYMLDILSRYTNLTNFNDIKNSYASFPKKSFDFEILEKEPSIAVVPFNGMWKDLGTWNALSEEMDDASIGKVVIDDSPNTNVVNELDIPIVCLGIKNAIVAASFDGIFIGDKERSVSLKDYVGRLGDLRPMYEERRWGEYKVLGRDKYADGLESLTKLLKFNDGAFISYQRHKLREEVWTFVNGEGLLVLDGRRINVRKGDVIKIEARQKHAVKSLRNLQIIEVQMGTKLTEDDIERFPWEW